MSDHRGLGSEPWLWRELERWVRRATAIMPKRYGSRFGKFTPIEYGRVFRSRAKDEWNKWGKGFVSLDRFVTAAAYALKKALKECCDNPQCKSIQATALFRVWESKIRPGILDAIDERTKHYEQQEVPNVRMPMMGFLRNVNQELKGTREAARNLRRKLDSLPQEGSEDGEEHPET